MNKNFLIGAIVLLVIVAAGLTFFSMNRGEGITSTSAATPTGTIATATPIAQVPGTPVATPIKVSMPVVITSSSIFASDTTARVNGTVNPGGPLTSYWFEYGTDSKLGTKTPNQTIGSGFVAIQAPGYITNLIKNKKYYVRLVAENQYGQVAGSQYTFTTTEGTLPPMGNVPTVKTVSATSVSRMTARVNGEITPNKAETQYWFEYGKTNQLGNVSALTSVGDSGVKVVVSTLLADLDPLTTYYFRLNAQNQYGTVNGTILTFKTIGPAAATAPTVVTQNAVSIGTSTAALRGTVNPHGVDTKYWFEYSTNQLLGSLAFDITDEVSLDASTNTTSVVGNIANLELKTTYYFRIVAENAMGTIRGDTITLKTK